MSLKVLKLSKFILKYVNARRVQTKQVFEVRHLPPYVQLSDAFIMNKEFHARAEVLIDDMIVHENFLTVEDEISIVNEIEPYLKRMRYEFDHWDDAIHGYRETERLNWNENNNKILNKIRKVAFSSNAATLKHVHILDLEKNGYIKPHIDAVRFCGDTITGLSLLSDSVMRLVCEKDKSLYADILLKCRSLYVMKNSARYEYTHEIRSDKLSTFKNEAIPRDRRISIICRNEPKSGDK